jgi:hypothetical protein
VTYRNHTAAYSSFIMLPTQWKLVVAITLFGLFPNMFTATLNTEGLKALLSPSATIVNNTSGAPRWSDFRAPTPGVVVNVASENDVLVTVSLLIIQKSSRTLTFVYEYS